MTGRMKKSRTHRRRKRRGGVAGISIYVRCQFCGKEFKGDSNALREWSEHLIPCKEEYTEKAMNKQG